MQCCRHLDLRSRPDQCQNRADLHPAETDEEPVVVADPCQRLAPSPSQQHGPGNSAINVDVPFIVAAQGSWDGTPSLPIIRCTQSTGAWGQFDNIYCLYLLVHLNLEPWPLSAKPPSKCSIDPCQVDALGRSPKGVQRAVGNRNCKLYGAKHSYRTNLCRASFTRAPEGGKGVQQEIKQRHTLASLLHHSRGYSMCAQARNTNKRGAHKRAGTVKQPKRLHTDMRFISDQHLALTYGNIFILDGSLLLRAGFITGPASLHASGIANQALPISAFDSEILTTSNQLEM